ncbi:hypothetical protein SDC9_96507 [bioreactor metagenome]|uniref:Uncharacterized protein n=1 Tax=bioreactor metagenome TaxID=1076179 RepID=A0A645AA47_9ZZZZ
MKFEHIKNEIECNGIIRVIIEIISHHIIWVNIHEIVIAGIPEPEFVADIQCNRRCCPCRQDGV